MLIPSLCSPEHSQPGTGSLTLGSKTEGLEVGSTRSVVTYHHHKVSPKFWRRVGSPTLEGLKVGGEGQ